MSTDTPTRWFVSNKDYAGFSLREMISDLSARIEAAEATITSDGKVIDQDRERLSSVTEERDSLKRALEGAREAQMQLNEIVDYIMGYWPLSMCYVNPMQAIQVMVNRMVKAESALKDARPDAGEGLLTFASRIRWALAHLPTLDKETRADVKRARGDIEVILEAARALGRGEGKA